MKWADHRRWASKFGIHQDATEYVNRIIDLSDENRLPKEYKQAVADTADQITSTRGSTKGNSALSRVITKGTMRHDSGRQKSTRGDLAAECTLEHLSQKGDDYVNAWYLHHHLDYLCEQSASGDSVEVVIDRYRREYPEAHSRRVEAFLREGMNDLRAELGYVNSS